MCFGVLVLFLFSRPSCLFGSVCLCWQAAVTRSSCGRPFSRRPSLRWGVWAAWGGLGELGVEVEVGVWRLAFGVGVGVGAWV